MTFGVVRREGVRVLLVDPGRRILLFRTFGMVGRHAWVPPGGAVEPNETLWDAARRELAEETGFTDLEIGDVVASTRERHKIDGWVHDCIEHVFVAWCTTTDVDTSGFSDQERWRIDRFEWWSPSDIATSRDEFFPSDLPLLARVLTT
jgi:ADP-ribose pyrophosphatase YjhB (NUDIX family)